MHRRTACNNEYVVVIAEHLVCKPAFLKAGKTVSYTRGYRLCYSTRLFMYLLEHEVLESAFFSFRYIPCRSLDFLGYLVSMQIAECGSVL